MVENEHYITQLMPMKYQVTYSVWKRTFIREWGK